MLSIVSRILKDEEGLKLDFWIHSRLTQKSEAKCCCSALWHFWIPLKNSEWVRKRRGSKQQEKVLEVKEGEEIEVGLRNRTVGG